ncbi:phosphate ABC transporter substrate-binding protein [Verrucomicrobium sp. BvORR034]|uniref:phosphate ABC transporter substrate-binding protein n=1 Tax=Verrucomicrobium sp. BvORR034 TaxID=1396418 RepID=UPI0022410075|nr:phosphate ABC transporter substrate-binding protein [Verrucomicrobium sp. BvORR034]
MGQSLCEGSESLPLVTTTPSPWGNWMFQRGVRTWAHGPWSAKPEGRPAEDFALVPLQASMNGGTGETIANGLADHLKATLPGVASQAGEAPHFLVTYAGQGGRGIDELSSANQSADPRSPETKRHAGGFYVTSLDDARRAVALSKARGQDFAITALVWMQGEANGGPTGGLVPSRWEAELPAPKGQEWYRDRLVSYRKQWSDDLRAITGQAGEIPLFTYQTLGAAGHAQLMAADQDPHLYMVGPHYMVPSAINSRYAGRHGEGIHLAADGERWYGEQVAKVVRRVLIEKEDWQPLRPRRAVPEAGRSSVLVDFIVPRPPLVLDDAFLPRQQSAAGKPGTYGSLAGFQLRNQSGAVIALEAVQLSSATQVRLKLAAPLPPGAQIKISYGVPYLGAVGRITAVRLTPVVEGQPATTELAVAREGSSISLKLDEGTCYIANQAPAAAATRAPIRDLRDEDGKIVIRIENRELRNQVPFLEGQTLVAYRAFSYGNLRDSDPEKAVYAFGDREYGTRAGQPYPLWNWCVLFNSFPVEELSP